MAISETRLDNLTALPSSMAYSEKYESVKRALSAYKLWPSGMKYEQPYLQGSYANATHIKGESDVDIVVEMTSTYYYDDNYLRDADKAALQRDALPGTSSWSEFRTHVLAALREYFGTSRVQEGDKSVKVLPPPSGGLYADIIVCAKYRVYWAYSDILQNRYSDGIVF